MGADEPASHLFLQGSFSVFHLSHSFPKGELGDILKRRRQESHFLRDGLF